MIHTEALSDLWSRLVQGERKSIKFESSLIFVWLEVTGGAEKGTMCLAAMKTAFEPMLSVTFKCCQYFQTLLQNEKKIFKKCGQ